MIILDTINKNEKPALKDIFHVIDEWKKLIDNSFDYSDYAFNYDQIINEIFEYFGYKFKRFNVHIGYTYFPQVGFPKVYDEDEPLDYLPSSSKYKDIFEEGGDKYIVLRNEEMCDPRDYMHQYFTATMINQFKVA